MTGQRRDVAAAVVSCLLGSALVLFGASTTWVQVRVTDAAAAGAGEAGTVGTDTGVAAAPWAVDLTGGELAPAVTALGLVGLAAVVAVAGTRRMGRVLVGMLVLLAGVAIVALAGRAAVDPASAVRAASRVREIVPAGSANLFDLHRTAALWLSLCGGTFLALGGAVVALRGYSWSALSARYQAPAARPVDAWTAIDRGEDPTTRPGHGSPLSPGNTE